MGRTNIVLDDGLVEEGMRLTGARTRRELVHQALEAYVAWLNQREIRSLRGKVVFREGYDHVHLRHGRDDS